MCTPTSRGWTPRRLRDAQEKDDSLAASKKTQDANTTMTLTSIHVRRPVRPSSTEVEQMTIAQRSRASSTTTATRPEAAGKHAKHVEHKHGRKDEHKWISDCLYLLLPRYDTRRRARCGHDRDSKMDLFHVSASPRGRSPRALRRPSRSSVDLPQYAKSAPPAPSATSALTMQKRADQPRPRPRALQRAFSDARSRRDERADQVDDTLYRDAARACKGGPPRWATTASSCTSSSRSCA